jgi:diguanylate cyclase (GGDEF)-like protein
MIEPLETSTTETYRILVVDDNPDTVRVTRDWLKGKPFEILEAANGERGLVMAVEDAPDVILLDLTMPGIGGISVARKLKADPATRAIPVIVLTSCHDKNSKVEAFAAGADDYMVKPFEVEEVEARIRNWLNKRNVLRTLETQVRTLSTSNQNLERLAMIDEKTGLSNFRDFQRTLRNEMERAQRYSVPLSLVFFDLDHFKQVNDSLGHLAGDRVLREFATLVTGGARANDVAARYGGEEFAVVLPHTGSEMALRVAERIRRAVQEFVFVEDESPTRITVSAGIATYPSFDDVDSVDGLIRSADRALFRAKDLGRNRVVVATAEPGSKL